MFSHSEVYLWVASRIWEVPPDWRAIRTQPVKSKAGCVVYMEKIPFSPPDITQAEIDEVVDTLRSGWITTGPKSKQFEREIAAYCGTDTAVCLNSATASLELTLRVLGIGHRHQDRSEIGNALHPEHHEEDAALMLEMGVNAVRLAHYPQATYFYDLMDKLGIVVWAEIPFIGPGGYEDKGFVDSPSFRTNGKEQLKELIRQHYNHPSICVWGLFNELAEYGDNPVEYINELNVLAHQEDTTRPTTSASNQSGKINFVTDLIAWNRYDGWYGGTPQDLGKWLDWMHKEYPEIRIAISEYGAGASIYHQQDSLVKTNPTSWWHPENWQTYYHIENWKAITERPFVWGSFVWNMFDFGAAHRTEGDRPGVNDKGLVTFDRKVRKDAFYFYKANWNKEDPMIYLIGKRNIIRVQRQQTIIAFSNQPEAELFVNGKSCGKVETDRYSILEWKHVILTPGKNKIEVKTTNKKQTLTDMYYCIL